MKNLVLSIMLYGVFLRTGYFGDEVPDEGARIRVMVVLHRLLEIQARRKIEITRMYFVKMHNSRNPCELGFELYFEAV